MLRIFILSLFCVCLTSCKNNQKTVLVVGDSWAFLSCLYKSLDQALVKAEVTDAGVNKDCALTSIVGAEVSDWLTTSQHEQTLRALKDPSVKVVYISLGGNDMINTWNKNMTPQQLNSLVLDLKTNLNNILEIYRAARPDVRFLVSGYDYTRFTYNHPIPDYAEAFEEMGFPQPSEINRAMIILSEKFLSLSESPNTAFLHHLGLMHYHFGHLEAGLQPKTTKPPALISKPGETLNTYGGVSGLSTDAAAMETVLGGQIVDAFHLSKLGYLLVAEHTVEQYLKEWLR